MLVQGRAGYIPGALEGVQADVIFLGTGGLGDLPAQEQENYYHEMVEVTGAKIIYPIHWEIMSTSLTEPFLPETNFERAMSFLESKTQGNGIPYELLPKGEPVQIEATR